MKQVLDFKPLLGMSSQMSDEHQRNWTKDKWEKKVSAPEYNYDQTRAHLNFEVAHGGIIMPIDTSKNVPQKMKDRFAKLGIKDPNLKKGKRKYRTVATVIIGGSTKLINKLAFGNQKVDFNKGADNSKIKRHRDIEDWAKDMYAFASEQWGEDNIVGFYVHLDESWVHIHCSVMPITKDGKLNFNRWYTDDGKYDFRERMLFWHDRLAEYNQKWGLARGTSVKVTGAKHISTEEYRRNLAKKCAELEEKIARREVTLEEIMKELDRAKRAVYSQKSMLKNLEEKRSVILGDIDRLKQSVKDEECEALALGKEIAEKEKNLADIDAAINDRHERIAMSYEELDFLKDQIAQLRLNYDGLITMINDSVNNNELRIKQAIATAGFEELIYTFNDFFSRIVTKEEAEHFEGTLIKDMTTRGNQIFKCAFMLFVGFVNYATEIARSNGGGGDTSSDLHWGRREDEDDLAFARRCLRQAQLMTRPQIIQRPKFRR